MVKMGVFGEAISWSFEIFVCLSFMYHVFLHMNKNNLAKFLN